MQAVLSSAGASEAAIGAVQEVHDSCPTCKFLHSRYFRKPVSSLPKYRQFLECLRVDFLYIEPGVYFLHAVDSFSRYNLGQIVFFAVGRFHMPGVAAQCANSAISPQENRF